MSGPRRSEHDGGLFHRGSEDTLALGIDQSYTGFAVTAMVDHGDPLFHSWVYASQGTGVKRVKDIRDFLDRIVLTLTEAYLDIGSNVAMEGYAPGARYGREMAGELGGMVKMWLWETQEVEPLIVAPSSLKKYVTGKGTGIQKNQMLLQTYKKWGVEFHDDNMCDSYGLARIASGRHDLAYEREVHDKLRR